MSNFKEAYDNYINEGVARHQAILLAQKDREIEQLHKLLKDKERTIEVLNATRESFIKERIEGFTETIKENQHLHKTVNSLSSRVTQLQRSRDYFKNEYKKLCKALESALQIGGTPVNNQID